MKSLNANDLAIISICAHKVMGLRPNMKHQEAHLLHRIGWLRAAVLGANDGIISTASLMAGVAGAAASKSDILVAGLVAGAMSMAAGEFVLGDGSHGLNCSHRTFGRYAAIR